MKEKNMRPVCHNSEAKVGKKCKQCGWKVYDDMGFYKAKGFVIENDEIVVGENGKPVTTKRVCAPMLLNKIYAIADIIISIPLLLLGVFLWAFDGFVGSPLVGALWLLLYGGVAIFNIIKSIFLLLRTKFGYILNRIMNFFCVWLFGGLLIFFVLSDCGFLASISLILTIFSFFLWKKSTKKIYLILVAIMGVISSLFIIGDLDVFIFCICCLFAFNFFLLRYYHKNKDMFLGNVKRKEANVNVETDVLQEQVHKEEITDGNTNQN